MYANTQYLEVRGIPELQALIKDLTDMERILEDPTSEAHEIIEQRIKEYPSPPPGSTYQRTYQLQNSWQSTVLMLSNGTMGVTRSQGVNYNLYVQDENTQATVHAANDWPTIQNVPSEKEDEIFSIYERYIQARIDRVR